MGNNLNISSKQWKNILKIDDEVHPNLPNCTVVQSQSHQKYLRFQWTFLDKPIFDQWKIKLDKISQALQKQQQIKPFILLPDKINYQSENMCGPSGLIQGFYGQQISWTLSSEILERSDNNQPFSEEFIWKVLYILLKITDFFQFKKLDLGEIKCQNIFSNRKKEVILGCQFSWPINPSFSENSMEESEIFSFINFRIVVVIVSLVLLKDYSKDETFSSSNFNILKNLMISEVLKISYYSCQIISVLVCLLQGGAEHSELQKIQKVLTKYPQQILAEKFNPSNQFNYFTERFYRIQSKRQNKKTNLIYWNYSWRQCKRSNQKEFIIPQQNKLLIEKNPQKKLNVPIGNLEKISSPIDSLLSDKKEEGENILDEFYDQQKQRKETLNSVSSFEYSPSLQIQEESSRKLLSYFVTSPKNQNQLNRFFEHSSQPFKKKNSPIKEQQAESIKQSVVQSRFSRVSKTKNEEKILPPIHQMDINNFISYHYSLSSQPRQTKQSLRNTMKEQVYPPTMSYRNTVAVVSQNENQRCESDQFTFSYHKN